MVRKNIFLSSYSDYWEGRTVHFLQQQSIVAISKVGDYGIQKISAYMTSASAQSSDSDIYISVRQPDTSCCYCIPAGTPITLQTAVTEKSIITYLLLGIFLLDEPGDKTYAS